MELNEDDDAVSLELEALTAVWPDAFRILDRDDGSQRGQTRVEVRFFKEQTEFLSPSLF